MARENLRIIQNRPNQHNIYGLTLFIAMGIGILSKAEGQYYHMIDNYLEQEYHSYDQVYIHPQYRTCIYIGDMQAATDHQFHSKCNVKTIVTAASNMDHLLYKATIKHIVYPLLDSKSQNIATLFRQFYSVIENHAPLGNILVHCSAGISRSSTLVISYIMSKEKLSFKQAIALVRASRPKVLPNLGFERQLKNYEEVVRKNMKSEKVARRKQVKTSQSGKSERLVKIDLFPFSKGLPSLALQQNKAMDKTKRYIYNIEKQQDSGRKQFSRNRVILTDKLKKLTPNNYRALKTEQIERQEQSLLQALKIQNKTIKSKTIVTEKPSTEGANRQDIINKYLSSCRKKTIQKHFKLEQIQ